MGNAHQHMVQERCKKLLLKLNPSLKFMVDKKNFLSAAPMLVGEEFVKQATTTVDQLKVIRKCNKDENRSFSGYHPRNYQTGRRVDSVVAVDDTTLTAGDAATQLNTPATKEQATNDRNLGYR